MANSANLPAPYGGQDTNTPNAVLKSPFCETLYNFNTSEAGISLRNGDAKWASKLVNATGGTTAEIFNGFVPYGANALFMNLYSNIGLSRYYDISTSGGAPSLAHTSTTILSPNAEVFTTYFNKRAFTFSTQDSAGDYYDGTTWGAWGYTMPATYNPIGGCAYKNRQYFIFRGTSSYGYSEIDAITGAVTLVQLGGVIAEESNLAIIAPISISSETSSVQLLAFVFFSGEVLFYSGSYPDSPTWSLVSSANLAEPLNYNAKISPYRGDSLVATRNGLSSLRDLFLRGSEDAEAKLISEKITPDWTALIEKIIAAGIATSEGRIKAVSLNWWKQKNRIIVSIPYYLDSAGTLNIGNTFFVYDTLHSSWAIHRSFGIGSFGSSNVIYFKRSILFCSAQVATAADLLVITQKEGATDFQDIASDGTTKISYTYEMLSAPIPFPKTAVYETDFIEPILESDLYAETNWNFVVDFGRQTSGNQTTDAATTSVAKPGVNVGMQNITYVQVKMSGTTAASKTVGLDLYSYNIWYSSGETASR